jgi:hypothetical protein
VSVGFIIDKPSIDSRAGQLVLNLRKALQDCSDMCDLLNDTSVFPADNSTLTGMGYSAGDITFLRNAFTDLKKLNQIAHSAATQSATNDFFFSAKHLTGLQ